MTHEWCYYYFRPIHKLEKPPTRKVKTTTIIFCGAEAACRETTVSNRCCRTYKRAQYKDRQISIECY